MNCGISAALIGAAGSCAMAQCPLQWSATGFGPSGALVSPYLTNADMVMWDPDLDGPMTPRVVVATGWLEMSPRVYGLAAWNPADGSWETSLGNSGGKFIAVLQDNTIVVAGQVYSYDGQFFRNVARWNGSAWITMGDGIYGTVTGLVASGDGVVVIGQNPGTTGQVSAWHPDTGWQAIHTGIAGQLHAVISLDNGDVIVGGTFTEIDGAPMGSVARWDGASWQSMGSGMTDGVTCLTQSPDGTIYAGLLSTMTFGDGIASNIAKWNGTEWERVGHDLRGRVGKLVFLGDGSMLVLPSGSGNGLFFLGDSTTPTYAMRLVNGDWTPFGPTPNARVMNALELDDGRLLVRGSLPSNLMILHPQDWCASCPPCMADFDQDGGVTSADVGAFMDAWEIGAACADVLYNGGVDGTDLAAFFAAYEAGGC